MQLVEIIKAESEERGFEVASVVETMMDKPGLGFTAIVVSRGSVEVCFAVTKSSVDAEVLSNEEPDLDFHVTVAESKGKIGCHSWRVHAPRLDAAYQMNVYAAAVSTVMAALSQIGGE